MILSDGLEEMSSLSSWRTRVWRKQRRKRRDYVAFCRGNTAEKMWIIVFLQVLVWLCTARRRIPMPVCLKKRIMQCTVRNRVEKMALNWLGQRMSDRRAMKQSALTKENWSIKRIRSFWLLQSVWWPMLRIWKAHSICCWKRLRIDMIWILWLSLKRMKLRNIWRWPTILQDASWLRTIGFLPRCIWRMCGLNPDSVWFWHMNNW